MVIEAKPWLLIPAGQPIIDPQDLSSAQGPPPHQQSSGE